MSSDHRSSLRFELLGCFLQGHGFVLPDLTNKLFVDLNLVAIFLQLRGLQFRFSLIKSGESFLQRRTSGLSISHRGSRG